MLDVGFVERGKKGASKDLFKIIVHYQCLYGRRVLKEERARNHVKSNRGLKEEELKIVWLV